MMSLRILQVLILFGTTQFELGHCKSLEIESLQISIPQKFLGSDQTRCLIMIFVSRTFFQFLLSTTHNEFPPL